LEISGCDRDGQRYVLGWPDGGGPAGWRKCRPPGAVGGAAAWGGPAAVGLAVGLPGAARGAAAWGGPAVVGLAAGLPGAPGGAWPSPVPVGTAGPSMVFTGAAPV
jgi:hypothetical protein